MVSIHSCVSTLGMASLLLGCASQAGTTPEQAAPSVGSSHPSATAATVAPVPAGSARPVHWGYRGEESPAHWAQLSEAYAACAQGTAQAPVDLPPALQPAEGHVAFNYTTSGLAIAHNEHVHDLQDNGHTIQVTVDEGSTLTTAKDTYALLQFHFHTPSENTVGGQHFPMEAHFVHQAEDGSFAVVAVFFDEGEANANLATLIDHFPAKGEAKQVDDQSIDLATHLPATLTTYAFTGSFTTPPCTPDVEWFVLQKPLSASSEQLAAFAGRLDHNNRPTQPLNGRTVQATVVRGSIAP